MSEMNNVKTFHKALKDNGYLCTTDFANKVYCALEKKPMSITTLIGQAGTGKSFLPEVLGKVLNCNVHVKQAYQGMDWDEFVRKYEPDDKSTSGIKARDAEVLVAVKESKEKKVILLLDEWDKTRISSDSYFLDFLQTGRLSVGGKKYKANLDNLIIFFTSNNERDVSEPLLRRGKVIVVDHLPVSLVANVLRDKYSDNKVALNKIEPTLKLYHTCINSKMDKPATIQELCDLINDWVTYEIQNLDMNWNELVYTNVTKNDRNHIALQKAIRDESERKESGDDKLDTTLDAEYFNNKVNTSEDVAKGESFMPRMMKLRNFDTVIDYEPSEVDQDIYADVERNDESYTSAFLEAYDEDTNIDVPHFLGFNTITNDAMQRNKPYRLSTLIDEYPKFKRMIKSDGVVVFIERVASKDDVVNMIQDISDQYGNAFVRKADNDEIIFRITPDTRSNEGDINARWTKDSGCEFVVPTKVLRAFANYVAMTDWYDFREFNSDMKVGTYNTYMQPSYIKDGSLSYNSYQTIRRLGVTKDYLNINVGVGGQSYTHDDNIAEHNALVMSNEAKVKQTSRTTTYDMGWAIVRSWHRKNFPNYKTNVRIKSRPPKDKSCIRSIDLIRYKLGLQRGGRGILPLFVTLDRSQFNECNDHVWKNVNGKANRKVNAKDEFNSYAIDTHEDTVFMVDPNEKTMDKIDSAFDFVDALRTMRTKTLELVC